jgi:Mn-dependent DtxR family transcriptional regulator
MISLTENESHALKIIRKWQERFRNYPTTTELAEEMKLSAETTRYALHGLLNKGFIDMLSPSTGTSRRMMIVPLWWE